MEKKYRSLSEIARDIWKDWPEAWYGAVPYIEAMEELNTIHDRYYQDSARDIVIRFLGNATRWRGPVAKDIKSELRAMLKEGGR